MTGEAEAVLARLAIDGPVPAALCLFDPDWHPGVVGLVASRMKDRLHRPVIAFAPAAPGSSELRGSARSIPGFHVRDALAAVSARAPGLVPRFGGHAMAAGLSLARQDFEAFHGAFRQHAAETLDAATLQAELATDGRWSRTSSTSRPPARCAMVAPGDRHSRSRSSTGSSTWPGGDRSANGT